MSHFKFYSAGFNFSFELRRKSKINIIQLMRNVIFSDINHSLIFKKARLIVLGLF